MRWVLLIVLGTGIVAFLSVPDIPAFFIAMLVMLVAFVLGFAKLAVDLVDLIRSELIADAALLVAIGLALTRITSGDRLLIGTLIAIAFASQATALALGHARPRQA